MKNINNSNFSQLTNYYDNVLNLDKTTYKSSNDEPTPIKCVNEMISKIPDELWKRKSLKILDPCCGNGNFFIPILFKLKEFYSNETILNDILFFNDINDDRLTNIRNIFCNNNYYTLNITNNDFLIENNENKYDLIVANPPYAKILNNGKRSSKNHNLIKDFLEKSLQYLKPNGYLLFITPDNWMSFSKRNILIEKLTSLQIIYLNIHTAKKYFKKIGSSFTWYIIQNCPFYKPIEISGIWKKTIYTDNVISKKRKYIPLLFNQIVNNILEKTIDSKLEKYNVKTSSFLHRYTKSDIISNFETEIYKYRLIHTPSKVVWASKPHIYQECFKVFIPTTDKYKPFVDNCGMTQSIVFIICNNYKEANIIKQILEHPLYVFINNICRWGNFNNIKILQSFPKVNIEKENELNENFIYNYFGITDEEKIFIQNNL